jgi:sarcosine oxidase
MTGTARENEERSVWSATAAIRAPACEPLEEDAQADVAIVGGGFCGLSSALHLAEMGVKVRLMEAHSIGFGASGRNGGQANPGVKLGEEALAARFGEAGRGLFRLGEEAVDFLADLVARKGLECRFRKPGVIRLAHSEAALRATQEACEALRKRGIAADLLSAREAAEMVGTRHYSGGMIDPRGGNLHPLDLARELARAAGEAGARIHADSPVTGLSQVGDRWKVSTAQGGVTADQVLIATNGYTDGLVPFLARSLLPVNSFQIATEPIDPAVCEDILPGGQAAYDSRRLILYFRKTADRRVILGGRASFSTSRDDRRSAGDYDVLVQVLHQLFPRLTRTRIAHRWTGLVCITPDFLPRYHAPAPGLHVALGFNGRGVAMATRTGAWLARKLTGREDTGEIPATPIRPIPFHAVREPFLDLAMRWNHLMDRLGR